ncbi:hypothetical protein B0I37DRAFT_371838 [Chaetomium sp. MPI-CAGE-AT-0009]|nr:hypothetical protein B0I37DRAFT_371838 [Chaetomium sp. MPI-CAGE-AT-0009]
MNIIFNKDFVDAFHGRHSALLSQLGPLAHETDTAVMVSACQVELQSLLEDLMKRAQGHRVGWERLKGAFQATSILFRLLVYTFARLKRPEPERSRPRRGKLL